MSDSKSNRAIDIGVLEDIVSLQNNIIDELHDLESEYIKLGNNPIVTVNQLRNKLEFILWMKRKFQLRTKKKPTVVKQREIFYCELGSNIGSEQGLKRPVVILQNDKGNSSGDTTVIAPITTYENSEFFKKDEKTYIRYIENGKTFERALFYYEIEVKLESHATQHVHGVINIAHMREISEKRLSEIPVAKITTKNFNDVIMAINHNLRVI
jgi:Growth inhibitor